MATPQFALRQACWRPRKEQHFCWFARESSAGVRHQATDGMQTAFQSRQTALVTGGARGIGREVARELARDGLRVLLGVRDLRRGEEAAAALGGEVAAVELDLSSAASIAACARRLQGPIDVLVNNAGV
jgi:hypothetical protein